MIRPHATVVIPTHNGMPLVERCLRAVLAQATPWPFEVIVIDSGSVDGTWELVETLPVRRFRISPREFNHGATRNIASSHAHGEFLVFLVQDAIPADGHWLSHLIAATDTGPRVAGAYSRQIARPESTPITHYMTIGTTPTGGQPEFKTLPPETRLDALEPLSQFRLALFQNNSSCIRRSVWLDYPFGVLPYGEDIEWGKRVIEAGFAIVYAPASAVYHSHDRSPLYAFKRAYADHFQVAELFGLVMIPSLARALRLTILETVHACAYIARSRTSLGARLRYWLLAPMFMSALTAGQYLGSRSVRWMPQHRWLARFDTWLRVGV